MKRNLIYRLVGQILNLSFMFILLLPSHLSAGTPELLFEAGSQAGALYYNMGNAYFKSGQLGKSILYWEKAARMMGEDDDLAANLAIARARLADKLDEPVRLPVWDWFDLVRARFSTTALAHAAVIICFLLFVVMALRRWIIKNAAVKRGLLIPIWIIIALLIFDLSLVTLKARDDMHQREGILLVNEADVLSAPASLHEGTKVRIHRELHDWYEISVGKDKQGWIKRDALGVI